MKEIYNLIGIFIIPFTLVGQSNLLPNGSFEQGNDGLPTNFNQDLDGLDDWINFGSSDWIREGDILNSLNPAPLAYDGRYFIGFGPCEGAQVEISEFTYSFPYYYLETSFKYRTRQALSNSTEINYFMFRDKRFDETPPPCTDESAFSGDISKKIRVPAYSHDQWYNYSSVMDTEVPLVPSNVFNWFAIRGEFSDGTHESNKYMLIDDIKAELKPYCNHPCAPNKMEPILAHWTEEINGVYTEVLDPDLSLGTRSRSFPLEPVLLNLKNANFVRLTVKNRWGEEVIHEWFDPRGLSNAHWNQADFQVFSAGTKAFIQNRPDLFSVVWNGGFSGGRMQGVVTLKIEASNCSNGSHKVVYKDLTLFGQDVHPQPKYNTQKYFYRGCCTPGSKTHSSQLLKSSDKYEDFISYENGTSCTLAGGYIGEAGNFLEVLPGVEFSASALEPASSVNLQINSYCQPLATEEPLGKQLGSIDLESKKHLSIYPNPGKNQVTIRGISRLYCIRSVQGFPLDLGLVEIYESGKNELSLDVSNLPEGVFFLEAESTDGTIETLKLLIRK